MFAIIFWITVFVLGAWALYTGVTTPAEPPATEREDASSDGGGIDDVRAA